jgi:hypothetical protein
MNAKKIQFSFGFYNVNNFIRFNSCISPEEANANSVKIIDL